MTTKDEALKALDTALWRARAAATPTSILHIQVGHAIDALGQLKTALAHPEQEPVGEIGKIVMFGGDLKEVSWKNGKMPPAGSILYTTPPKRKPLSDEERVRLWNENHMRPMAFSRAVEAEHGIEDQP